MNAWFMIYRPKRYYAWLHRRYGDLATLRAPHVTVVMTLTSEGARQVLTEDPNVFGAFQQETFIGIAGPGSLFVRSGASHRRERKLLSPAFHAQHVRVYGEIIRDIALLHTSAWQPDQELRARDAMLDISRDVILRVVLGIDRGAALEEGRAVLRRMLDATHPLLEYIPAFQARWFPAWRRFRRARYEFSRFVERCIANRRAGRGDGEDVLSLLLESRYEDGSRMHDDEIGDELYTILLPGHATTGVALAWALYELGRHPLVLRRLRDELGLLGPSPEPQLIAKQPYLGAVCNETLRLHTIVTEIARLPLVPFVLLGNAIPAGVGVGVSISAIHQSPSIYPDPDQFRPERFFERSYGPFEFLPFGGSHRRCLGAALSDFEMRIALATIVTRWELHPIGEESEVRESLAVGPKHGVRVRIRRRTERMPPAYDEGSRYQSGHQ
jgi:cytochrome P450